MNEMEPPQMKEVLRLIKMRKKSKQEIQIEILKEKMPDFTKNQLRDFIRGLDYGAKFFKAEKNFRKVKERFDKLQKEVCDG